ncbi:tetratricopeptide repeat protein [Arthrobacter sp. Z1-9]
MLNIVARAKAVRHNRLALAALVQGNRGTAEDRARQALKALPQGCSLSAVTLRADILLTLGAISAEGRNHADAENHLKEAASILRGLPVSLTRDKWLAEVLTRLGDTFRLAANHREAIETFALARQLPNWDDLEPLRKAALLNAQGILAKDTGLYAEAKNHYDSAYELISAAVGTDSPLLAGLHHNYAGLFHVQGLYVEAEPDIRTALEMRKRADPPEPIGVAADMSVLGAVLAGQGRLSEAEEALMEALETWTALYGPDHYEVAVQLNNLGSVKQQIGELAAAHTNFEAALQIKERVLGREHPEIAALLNNLASLEADEGNKAAARAHYDEALAIFTRRLGPEHPSTTTCAANRQRSEG